MTECIFFTFYLFINNQLHKRDTEDQGKNQPILSFCSAEGAQRTFVKYSFTIRIYCFLKLRFVQVAASSAESGA